MIGLLPDLPRERFHYLGNSSLMGSYMVAVSSEYRQRQLELARRMTNIELSTDPAYMDQYTGALFLPHTDLGISRRLPTRWRRARARGRGSASESWRSCPGSRPASASGSPAGLPSPPRYELERNAGSGQRAKLRESG